MKRKIVTGCFFSIFALLFESILLTVPVSAWSGKILILFLRLCVVFAAVFCTVLFTEKLSSADSGTSDGDGKEAEDRNFKPDPRGYEIFSRGLEYMESAKPYLDSNLNLGKFSKAIFSNTAYVSKSINSYAGMNFKQFINSYRIDYAVELMKKDPYLRMEEVALMSGFNTAVSFDMSFKSFKGKTPTEWQKEFLKYRDEPTAVCPSKTPGQER